MLSRKTAFQVIIAWLIVFLPQRIMVELVFKTKYQSAVDYWNPFEILPDTTSLLSADYWYISVPIALFIISYLTGIIVPWILMRKSNVNKYYHLIYSSVLGVTAILPTIIVILLTDISCFCSLYVFEQYKINIVSLIVVFTLLGILSGWGIMLLNNYWKVKRAALKK